MRDTSAIRDFLFAGRAVFTIESAKTRAWYTYRVRAGKKDRGYASPRWFVDVLTGPSNTDNFTYMASLDERGNLYPARGKEKAPSILALGWFLRQLDGKSLPPSVTFHHEGRCGRCGRTLTTPDSTASGLGPECRAKMGR
ncbi:MAG: DUF6011 domain-containing protein [Gemmatimonadales bacterium]|nr:DUF6011 domain-containing protein [Gemmatimonadales bacterium]